MEIRIPSACSTTRWAGGTTTQLAICPPEADYAARDFLWRVSSARVAQEYSVFTSLPDYERFLGIAEGELFLQADDEGFFPLPAGQVWQFDGGRKVLSQGTCRDFNLMLRKGVCSGSMRGYRLGGTMQIDLPTPQKKYALRGLYCAAGSMQLCGEPMQPGELRLSADVQSFEVAGQGLLYAFTVESDDERILKF